MPRSHHIAGSAFLRKSREFQERAKTLAGRDRDLYIDLADRYFMAYQSIHRGDHVGAEVWVDSAQEILAKVQPQQARAAILAVA